MFRRLRRLTLLAAAVPVARRVLSEARKPENRRRASDLAGRVRGRKQSPQT